ncbi:MAG: hypothetical protein HC883_00625 [Bdellovibrionaceae bacterium]|nr:hypothetical protein [Pseudobdellovibrionaceae bacterium]
MEIFNYIPHDGTLPLDRVAMLDVWKEILLGVAQQPLLAQNFDIKEIFKYTAELGGAKNIENFELQPTAPAGMPLTAQPTGPA